MEIKILASKFYEHSQYFKGFSKHTIKRYQQAINFFCRFTGAILIEELTEEKIRSVLLHGRAVNNWKTTTYLSFHKSLSVFCRWCKEKGHLKNNPLDTIEVPRREFQLPPKLTKQQALRLLEIVFNYPYPNKFMQYRNHALFATLIFVGLRKSELLRLRYTDVDFENLSISVHQGKGFKDRIIPMSQTLSASLERYLLERKKANKTCPEFFASFPNNAGMSESSLIRLIGDIKKISGFSFSLHRLRHTFATLMLEGGCDIYSLAKMMGHNDIKTTTIYLYASADHLRSQMSKHPLNE